jgi:hypothetical protein
MLTSSWVQFLYQRIRGISLRFLSVFLFTQFLNVFEFVRSSDDIESDIPNHLIAQKFLLKLFRKDL